MIVELCGVSLIVVKPHAASLNQFLNNHILYNIVYQLRVHTNKLRCGLLVYFTPLNRKDLVFVSLPIKSFLSAESFLFSCSNWNYKHKTVITSLI